MTKNSVVVHEWFSGGGPNTYEYLLPLRDVPTEHSALLCDWFRQFAIVSPAEVRDAFRRYLTEITAPELEPLLKVISRLLPYSVVMHEQRAWLLCKTPDDLSETSCHGNMVLLPAPHHDMEEHLPSLFSSDAFQPLLQFLRHFAGMTIDIPPTSGCLWPDEIEPAVYDEETWVWKNIKSWQNSYVIYNVGDGNWLLVDSAGRFGQWDHEMTDQEFVDKMVAEHGMAKPDDGAVFLIGGFHDLVDFVVKGIGIAV